MSNPHAIVVASPLALSDSASRAKAMKMNDAAINWPGTGNRLSCFHDRQKMMPSPTIQAVTIPGTFYLLPVLPNPVKCWTAQ